MKIITIIVGAFLAFAATAFWTIVVLTQTFKLNNYVPENAVLITVIIILAASLGALFSSWLFAQI